MDRQVPSSEGGKSRTRDRSRIAIEGTRASAVLIVDWRACPRRRSDQASVGEVLTGRQARRSLAVRCLR